MANTKNGGVRISLRGSPSAMRYLFGFLCVCTLAALPLGASAQTAEEGTTSEPDVREPAPSAEPAPEEPALEVPDIDTLSQSAIEHYEIQSAQLTEEKKKHERRRRRGLAIGVSIAVAVVVVAVLGGATASSID